MTMTMTGGAAVGVRSDTRQVKVTAPVVLDDLRWMVDQCDGLDGTSQVRFHVQIPTNQRDEEVPSIVVHGIPQRRYNDPADPPGGCRPLPTEQELRDARRAR